MFIEKMYTKFQFCKFVRKYTRQTATSVISGSHSWGSLKMEGHTQSTSEEDKPPELFPAEVWMQIAHELHGRLKRKYAEIETHDDRSDRLNLVSHLYEILSLS
jgi:hypothetical protein